MLPLYLFLLCLLFLYLLLVFEIFLNYHGFAGLLESGEVALEVFLFGEFIFCIYFVSSFVIFEQIFPVSKNLVFIEGVNSLLFTPRCFGIFSCFWSQIRCILSFGEVTRISYRFIQTEIGEWVYRFLLFW